MCRVGAGWLLWASLLAQESPVDRGFLMFHTVATPQNVMKCPGSIPTRIRPMLVHKRLGPRCKGAESETILDQC